LPIFFTGDNTFSLSLAEHNVSLSALFSVS
jgi:hypothetical protein